MPIIAASHVSAVSLSSAITFLTRKLINRKFCNDYLVLAEFAIYVYYL